MLGEPTKIIIDRQISNLLPRQADFVRAPIRKPDIIRGGVSFEARDHVELIDALDHMADLTGDFAPPADACGSWRALYVGCRKLDADLRVHVHLENNLLFPRFS